ncbi:MAG TPA: BamA/TamA family outer membrane protein [Gemmatimonadales bacterium]|nr:BamA/TamA family outer membrane protein [Gemmatimonadales bacterium]
MRFAHSIALGALCALAARPLSAQQEPERVVRGLTVVGNRAFDDYTLKTVIATSNSSYFATAWWLRWLGLGAKRYFDEVEFQRDVVRLILFYRQSGYMQAVIDTTVRRTPHDVYITFQVYEGEPVRVRRLEVTGIEGIIDPDKLRRALPLKVGDPFNRLLFQASADTIGAWLRNRSYPYEQVLRNFDSDVNADTAVVRFDAVPGRRMWVGRVDVQGLHRVDTGTVLHTLSIKPGDQYHEDQLFRSQRDLYGSGVFRSAIVTLADSVPPEAGDSLADIQVSVVEGPRHRVRLGAGYGTLDCFRAQAGWSSFGFLGDARVLDLSLQVSKIGVGKPLDGGFAQNVCRALRDSVTGGNDRFSDTLNYNAAITLFQPAFLSPSHTASIGVFAERHSEVKTFARTQVGTTFSMTLNARRRVPVGVTYTYSVGRTDADPAVFCSVLNACDDSTQRFLNARRPFAAVGVTAAVRSENNPLDPISGGHFGVTLLNSSRFLGSSSLYEFNRGEMEVARFFPLGRRATLGWRFHVGAVFPGLVTVKGVASTQQFVPPDQRFYAGGPNSVRGFGANDLGPKVYVVDTSGVHVTGTDTTFTRVETSPTGGNALFVANAELRVPAPVFPERVQLAGFVDAGEVYIRQRDILSLKSMRVTPGVGVRVVTPLGPVRVDVAYNGYAPQSGVLWLSDGKNLTRLRTSFQQPRPATFLRRLLLQFAIGQAF